MEGSGGQVSEELLAVLLQAWSNAKSEGQMLGLAAGQIDKVMLDFKVPAGEGENEWTAEKIKAETPKYKLCHPITVAGRIRP